MEQSGEKEGLVIDSDKLYFMGMVIGIIADNELN